MKKYLPTILSLTFLVSISATLLSCKDDPEPAYSFKDQDASGKIGNISWTYEDGYSSVSGSGTSATVTLTLTVAQEEGKTGCMIGFAEGDAVHFNLPNAVGLYKLAFETNGHSVTLYHEAEFDNYIAVTGAVEITSITESEISGRIDARYDSENFVNGNFTIALCE